MTVKKQQPIIKIFKIWLINILNSCTTKYCKQQNFAMENNWIYLIAFPLKMFFDGYVTVKYKCVTVKKN